MPQPIDMQSEVTRISMAERMQDAATRGQVAAQQRTAQESQEQVQLRDSQVNETEETRNPEVDADGRKRERELNRRKNKRAMLGSEEAHTVYNAHESKEILDDPEDHRLDVTI